MSSIEAVKDFWNKQPCGILRAPGNRYRVQPHIAGFADFERWRGRRVLEIGCGIGEDTERFSEAGANVTAMDLSQESLRIATKRLAGRKNVLLWLRDAEDSLPPVEYGYDLIYSFGVIHHTPHPEKVLDNAREVIAASGELRIMLYARWSLKFLLKRQPEAQSGCPIVNTYSKRQARRLVESSGFKITSIVKTHIFPYRLNDYIQGYYVRAFPWNICPSWLFHWLEHRLGHHLLITARPS